MSILCGTALGISPVHFKRVSRFVAVSLECCGMERVEIETRNKAIWPNGTTRVNSDQEFQNQKLHADDRRTVAASSSQLRRKPFEEKASQRPSRALVLITRDQCQNLHALDLFLFLAVAGLTFTLCFPAAFRGKPGSSWAKIWARSNSSQCPPNTSKVAKRCPTQVLPSWKHHDWTLGSSAGSSSLGGLIQSDIRQEKPEGAPVRNLVALSWVPSDALWHFRFHVFFFSSARRFSCGTWSIYLKIQSTLSKADTLGTKATVQFREVSALERVPLQIYKCNSAGSGPNLLSGLESVRLCRV